MHLFGYCIFWMYLILLMKKFWTFLYKEVFKAAGKAASDKMRS